jgi:dolichol-phosphate mannosyltransferase
VAEAKSKNRNENFRVSVVLPSYNEKDNVEEVITRVSNALGKNLFEIIIVDDDSPDFTWKIVQDLKNPRVRVIRRINESGLASALWRGISEARGNVVAWLDCDLGLRPEDLPSLVEQLEDYDVVIGSRYVRGGGDPRPFWRSAISVVLNLYAMLWLGFKVRDYTSGFAACKKEVFEKIKFSPQGFGEYFIEFAYNCQKQKLRIKEVPVVYQVRKGGVSKSDGDMKTFFKLGIDYGIKIIKLRFGYV